MRFIDPIWLWGLLGLILPLAIHLLSRKEGKTIYIGSIRHLVDSNTARFSSLRLNEIILLLIRSSVIILLVIILAGLLVPPGNLFQKKWVLVEPGIARDKIGGIIDSLEREGFELRNFSKNFAYLSDSTVLAVTSNYRHLIEQLKDDRLTQAVIISNNYMNAFKGRRDELPQDFHWITLDPPITKFLQSTTPMPDNTFRIREGTTSAASTAFETRISVDPEGAPIISRDTVDVVIYFSDSHQRDQKIFSASLLTIEQEFNLPVRIDARATSSFQPQAGDWIVWLSNEQIPNVVPNTIAFTTCQANLPLIISRTEAKLHCRELSGANWYLTQHLDQEVALKKDLTITLANLIVPHDIRVAVKDHRALDSRLNWARPTSTQNKTSTAGQNAESLAAILLLFLLIIERWLSFRRGQ